MKPDDNCFIIESTEARRGFNGYVYQRVSPEGFMERFNNWKKSGFPMMSNEEFFENLKKRRIEHGLPDKKYIPKDL